MYTLVQYIYASKLTFMTFLFGIKIHLADFMHRCSASFYAMASLLQTLVYNLALYNSYVKCETYVHGQKNHANIVLSLTKRHAFMSTVENITYPVPSISTSYKKLSSKFS